MEQCNITTLITYPIKSLRGVTQDRVQVNRMGFSLDRRWLITDASGTFQTQRDHPVLATLDLAYDNELLRVATPQGSTIEIPINETSTQLIPVTIWNDRVDAFIHEADVDQFFSDVLSMEARLVRIPEAAVRPVDPAYGTKGDHVSFADGYPILLTASASLDDLNSRLDSPVPMDRFRPNLVVRTAEPFIEESWSSLSSDAASLRVVKRCARCVITTTDQRTGERTPEPLRTLAGYRKEGHAVNFGMNCIPDGEGYLSVGDHLSILP